MKTIVAVLGFAFLAACSSIKPAPAPLDSTQATLVVPFSIDLVAVDRVQPGFAHSGSDPQIYQIAPGARELEFIYKKTWGTGVSSELVTTDVFRASVNAAAGQTLEVDFTDDTASIRQNNQLDYKSEFALWITDTATGQRTDAAFSRNNRGILDSVQIGSQLSVNQQAALDPVSTVVPVPAVNSSGDSDSSLEQLKRWWTNASKQERADFLIWSTNQN